MMIPVPGDAGLDFSIRKEILLLLHRQGGGRPFLLYPFFLDFHSSHGRIRPLAFPCPEALGVSDEDSFPVGQKRVQDGLISLCFLKLLMLKPIASSQFLGNIQAGAELVRVVSALRLDSGGGFH